MRQLLKYFVATLVFSNCSLLGSEVKYICGKELNDTEILRFIQPDPFKYTKDDLLALENIKNKISPHSNDTSKIKVAYCFKTTNALAIEIYGIEQVSKIDTASCNYLMIQH